MDDELHVHLNGVIEEWSIGEVSILPKDVSEFFKVDIEIVSKGGRCRGCFRLRTGAAKDDAVPVAIFGVPVGGTDMAADISSLLHCYIPPYDCSVTVVRLVLAVDRMRVRLCCFHGRGVIGGKGKHCQCPPGSNR